jgi:hypothetical protein
MSSLKFMLTIASQTKTTHQMGTVCQKEGNTKDSQGTEYGL